MTTEYVGTKIVTAWAQEKDGQPGYAVKYKDGYISWSPKEVFEESYLMIGHISHLPEWHQRLLAEGTQLADKLEKLTRFLADPATAKDYSEVYELLKEQQVHMTNYLETLSKREAILQQA